MWGSSFLLPQSPGADAHAHAHAGGIGRSIGSRDLPKETVQILGVGLWTDERNACFVDKILLDLHMRRRTKKRESFNGFSKGQHVYPFRRENAINAINAIAASLSLSRGTLRSLNPKLRCTSHVQHLQCQTVYKVARHRNVAFVTTLCCNYL